MKPELIIALDFPTARDATPFIDKMHSIPCWFKVGKELFTMEGPNIVRYLKGHGHKVFLDLKYHDIPNTVQGACRAAAALGANMINVHASGGIPMIEAARKGCCENTTISPLLICVTVLTSMGPTDGLLLEWGSMEEATLALAHQSHIGGSDGVVCSGKELKVIKECLPNLLCVVPGIRPIDPNAKPDDQKRVVTPRQAVLDGADFLVVGRPITQAANPLDAAKAILDEIEGAYADRT